MKWEFLCVVLAACLFLGGCQTQPANQDAQSISQEIEVVENYEEVTSKDFQSDVVESSSQQINMKNVSLESVPQNYYNAADQQGSLENFSYDTKNYLSTEEAMRKNATVYLPFGYNQDDSATRYNILYLQHGAYGNERTWMYEYGDDFKNLIDNMIENKQIPPLIIVMPYLTSGNEWYHDTTPIFYSTELKNDLMPAIEAHFHTYAENTTDSGFKASRSHRAFGGFSAGGTTTWRVFLDGMERFEYFLPMSGGLTLGGDGSTNVEDATQIANIAIASGFDKREYYVFSATGTRDVAYQGLFAQIDYMKTLNSAFDFTATGFAEGNLMYYTVDGNRHDYPYTYEYVYNGLRCLFSWW